MFTVPYKLFVSNEALPKNMIDWRELPMKILELDDNRFKHLSDHLGFTQPDQLTVAIASCSDEGRGALLYHIMNEEEADLDKGQHCNVKILIALATFDEE